MQHTDSQLQVIGHRDGPMIVLAGAGSGKTSTICVRAAHMVRDRYCEPSQHLMLTFSRKASGEMRNRCVAVLRDLGSTAAARDINVDTYHAFGYRMIRDNPALANRREGMTLQDDADRKRMMRGICKAWNLDYKASPGRFEKWYQVYSLGKNYNLCASDTNPDIRARLLQLMQNADEKHDNDPEQVLAFAVEYERRMALQNTLDFDDLCLWSARGLSRHPELAKSYATRFPVITVDESQDTNMVQYALVDAIARHHRNITMVGDDDQSIYGWRGARVTNMRQFVKDYQPVQARLERNFRSTPALVEAAAGHIRHNTGRMDKKPFAEGDMGDKPHVMGHVTGWDMADEIGDQIQASLARGTQPEAIAVLYRTNRMARVIEGALRNRGIPYTIVGGHSLYDAAEVKAAIAGVRLMINGGDVQAAWQMLPHISGLGSKSLETLINDLEDEDLGGLDLFGAAARRGGRVMTSFVWLDERLELLRRWGPTRVGEWVLADEGLGYRRRLAERAQNAGQVEVEAERRIANLMALDKATTAAQRLQQSPTEDLSRLEGQFRLLLEAQLSDPGQTEDGLPARAVVLSTAHRAKGLEWSIVHVAGYSEGLIPLEAREDANAAGHLAEERRLSYVAITRAQHHCVLHHAQLMQFPGDAEPKQYEPSRFIQELGLAEPVYESAPRDAARGNHRLRPNFA